MNNSKTFNQLTPASIPNMPMEHSPAEYKCLEEDVKEIKHSY